jgi:hypothetical protein
MRRSRIAIASLVLVALSVGTAPIAASAWRGPRPVRELVPVIVDQVQVNEVLDGSSTNGTRWT